MPKRKDLLMIVGTNIKRTELHDYKLAMSRDRDITKLIFKGTFDVNWKPLIIIIGFFVFGLGINLVGLSNTFGSFISVFSGRIDLIIFFVMAVFLFAAINQTKNDIKTIVEKSDKAIKCLVYIFKRKAPRYPLQLWDVLQASIIDAQIAASAERLFDTDVSIIYGGQPYYDISAIDSIYIKWETTKPIPFSKIKKHLNKFFDQYAQKTIVGEIERRYFSKEERLQVSNCVFGVLFLSEYLHDFYVEFLEDIFNTNKTCNKKIFIDCSEIKKKGEKSVEKMRHIAQTIAGYSTNPEYFTFSKKDECIVTLKICDIDFFDRDVKGYTDKIAHKNEQLRLPVKKIIAIPVKNTEMYDGSVLPSMLEDRVDLKRRFSSAMVLGGAEQNIVLCYLINRYKWRFDNNVPGHKYHNFGFAENEFDAHANIDFLVGTEGFVYGEAKRLRAQTEDKTNCNIAEVFNIKIDGLKYAFIYGYHAVTTKITSLKYLVFLNDNDNEKYTEFIPSEKENSSKHRITYQLIHNDSSDFDKLCEFWDKDDHINQDKQSLLETLAKIEVQMGE